MSTLLPRTSYVMPSQFAGVLRETITYVAVDHKDGVLS